MHDKRRAMNVQPLSPAMRLLVADDNPVSRMIAASLAEKLGHVADLASDGEQALRMLERHDYDLVLMDCEMPQMDGYAACRRLRELEGTSRRTPVVALSAARGEDYRLACLEAGMDDFLFKPLGLDELQRVLARWQAAPVKPAHEETDDDRLDDVARHFGSRYGQLAALWLSDSPARMAVLRQAIASGEFLAAAAAAHALSGGSASIGAGRLSALCRQLEVDARSGKQMDFSAQLARIETAHADVSRRLRDMLASTDYSPSLG